MIFPEPPWPHAPTPAMTRPPTQVHRPGSPMIWRFLPCRPISDQGEGPVGSHPVPGKESVAGDHMPLPHGCACAQHPLRVGDCLGEQAWYVVTRASAWWNNVRSLRHGRSRGRCPTHQGPAAVPKGTQATGTGTVTHTLTRKTAPSPRFLEQAPSSSPLGPVRLPKRTGPHHHFDNAQETGVYGAMS